MNSKPITIQPLLTVEDVGKLLQKKPRTVREMVYRGKIPSLKVGSSIRFDLHRIQEWLRNDCQVDPGSTNTK